MNAITPIRTEEDYQQALARIESIFEASPGTAEFDELDMLTTLVQAYRRCFYTYATTVLADAPFTVSSTQVRLRP
ncbi:hypothetical protein [Hymenobacter weizhouensis]|uniref:hypothetical protein n=1 Tax=Hymenobacter sp. YIM 151500-1 TaxID=2987689 RepID=UPI002226A710|nr:hypothetical protein [Hymenobacter sp. YIM 151500-1]UYZ63993.1 hypothetical protein OIS53_03900 [Hymenobacter sp. YIM 151500-1]